MKWESAGGIAEKSPGASFDTALGRLRTRRVVLPRILTERAGAPKTPG